MKVASYLQQTRVQCLLLVVFGFVARWPALSGELIWDDKLLVRGNPMIRSPLLVLEAFRHYLFPDSYSGHYRPVQTVSYIFDDLIWNGDPFGFHLANILWHIAGGLLLYFLLRRLFSSLTEAPRENEANSLGERNKSYPSAAFLVALIWTVHPVHSAAVDYISGRADSLAFVFAAAGWLLFLKAGEEGRTVFRRSFYLLAIVSALLALSSRESGLIWLALFLIHLFTLEERLATKTKISVLLICLAIAAAYFGLRHLPESRPENIAGPGWSPAMRGQLMLGALGDYARLMLVPTNLHVERTILGPAGSLRFLVAGGLLTLAVLAYGLRRPGPAQRLRILGAAWFILSYLPTSNLFDLNATVAEHWLYLPSVGFLIFLAGVALDLPVRFRSAAVVFSGLLVVTFTALSMNRSGDWVNAETFFRKTFAAGATNSRIGVNLAVIYAERGEHAKAETILRKVLRVAPGNSLARNNLALALSQQGKAEEAKALFEGASKVRPGDQKVDPTSWDAALHLAKVFREEKNTAAALSLLEQARRDYPDTWQLVNFEAGLVRESEGIDAALPLVQDFVDRHWWHAGACFALGQLSAERGDKQKAEAAFRRASWLDFHETAALNSLAAMQADAGRFDAALRTQRRAIRRQPDQPQQHFFLARILARMGHSEESLQAVAEVGRLRGLAQQSAEK
ncbi:MAG: tetratricopeptide repeat protein [Chthoniobacterales bacterium]